MSANSSSSRPTDAVKRSTAILNLRTSLCQFQHGLRLKGQAANVVPTGVPALDGILPDGICLNENNQVWVANALGPEAVLVGPGGEVIERVQTSQPCYACMLGGADGKTLFALTAATSDGEKAAATASGRVETLQVDSARTGWP